MRILVVEASTEDGSTLAVALREDGYSAAFADDAVLVFEQLTRAPPLTASEMLLPGTDRAWYGEERPPSMLEYRRQHERRSRE